MIGKPEWFKRRKWGGWGVFPATWQGWVYLVIFLVLLFAIQILPLENKAKVIALSVLIVVLFLDTVDIMLRMKRDERETLHEALAERNALWVIILVLAAGLAYQAASTAIAGGELLVDPVILIALFSGLIAKAATNYRLDKTN